jgi:hypothetical protein
MGRDAVVAELLTEDPGLANARFRSVRTSDQAHHERDWATPLWFAGVNGRHDTVELLLRHGASGYVTDDAETSVVDHIEAAGQGDIARAIRQGSAQP